MAKLISVILGDSVFLIFGILFIAAGIYLGRKREDTGKRDVKMLAIGLVLGCIFTVISVKGIVGAGMDLVQGEKQAVLNDCTVYKNSSLKRIFHSYYLETKNYEGKIVRYKIDKEMYQRYEDEYLFSAEVIYWENSRIIKEIY